MGFLRFIGRYKNRIKKVYSIHKKFEFPFAGLSI